MDILHIGLQRSGRQWLNILRQRADITVVGCVEANAAARGAAGTHQFGLTCYETIAAALKEVSAEVALVASPPDLHTSHILQALEAGLAVMVDKPLAPSLSDGVHVMAMAHRVGLPVMMAPTDGDHRCERDVRSLIGAGQVGMITHVSCIDRRTARNVDESGSRDIKQVQLTEVAACHFDRLRHLLGVQPVRVMAQSSQTHGETTAAFWEMEQQIPIQYYGSLTSNRAAYELRIEGEYGALRTDMRHLWWRKRGARFFLPLWAPKRLADGRLPSTKGVVASWFDHCQAVIRHGAQPEPHGNDHLWSLAMVDAAKQSDRTGRVVAIAEVMAAAGMVSATIAEDRESTI